MIKKIYSILWIILVYLSVTLLVYNTSNNQMAKQTNNFLNNVFADIYFDSQSQNVWYNSKNSIATANVSPNAIPAPVNITIISRHSH